MTALRHAYLGPPGTNCEEALLALTAGSDIEAVPHGSEREAILALDGDAVHRAVVPIENALEGAVTGTLDTLALDVRDVRIVAEVVLPIEHCLIAGAGTEIGDVRVVVSHPQALAQCRRYVAGELGAIEQAATSTAEAVREVVGRPGHAAIANARAAEIYGGRILRRGIQDDDGNATRFVLLARSGDEAAAAGRTGARHRTTVVFWGGGDQEAGWLLRCLAEFADRDVSLTKIESRPRKVGLGRYLFVVDAAGAEHDEAVAAALEGLASHCEEVRILGSYPSA